MDRGGRDPFFDFGDPFGGFGGFGSLGPPRSLLSSFFGGRDPFDDFFNRPMGGIFESSPFGGPSGFPGFPGFPGFHGMPFPQEMRPSGFLEQHQQHQAPESSARRGPIIEELSSDDESEGAKEENRGNPRKHGRSRNEPLVEHPDEQSEGKRSRHLLGRNEYNRNELNRFNVTASQPQAQTFCFQSSTVSYGGPNGTYYTSSRTRRSGSDGVTLEETKEADSSTREASHRISRGIHGKGHSLARKLNSDGKVDTMQTLHNLNEDELAGFEEEWKGKGQKYLPGWTGSTGAVPNGQIGQARLGGWALPSSEHNYPSRPVSEVQDGAGSSRPQQRARTDSSGRSAYHPRGWGQN